jgi:hypothetical protein
LAQLASGVTQNDRAIPIFHREALAEMADDKAFL